MVDVFSIKITQLLINFNYEKYEKFSNLSFQSLFHTVGGHSSVVTRVDFLADDTRLVSAGGRDTAIMQWALQ